MKVASINQQKSTYFTFKRGLTAKQVLEVKNLSRKESLKIVENLRNHFNINVRDDLPRSVLKSVEWTAKIMTKAGFKLPKNFEFEPFYKKNRQNVLGCYNPTMDIVSINSLLPQFYDIEKQNKEEENYGNFHTDTKHFLDSYLHEFAHAAHYKNLRDNSCDDVEWYCKVNQLDTLIPKDVVIGPICSMFSDFNPSYLAKLVRKILPVENGWYAKTNLIEYMAEYISRNLSLSLGKNFDINKVPDLKSQFTGFPEDWDYQKEKEELDKLKFQRDHATVMNFFIPGSGMMSRIFASQNITRIFLQDINYLNGEIWNGNIDNIKEKSLSIENKD